MITPSPEGSGKLKAWPTSPVVKVAPPCSVPLLPATESSALPSPLNHPVKAADGGSAMAFNWVLPSAVGYVMSAGLFQTIVGVPFKTLICTVAEFVV